MLSSFLAHLNIQWKDRLYVLKVVELWFHVNFEISMQIFASFPIFCWTHIVVWCIFYKKSPHLQFFGAACVEIGRFQLNVFTIFWDFYSYEKWWRNTKNLSTCPGLSNFNDRKTECPYLCPPPRTIEFRTNECCEPCA